MNPSEIGVLKPDVLPEQYKQVTPFDRWMALTRHPCCRQRATNLGYWPFL